MFYQLYLPSGDHFTHSSSCLSRTGISLQTFASLITISYNKTCNLVINYHITGNLIVVKVTFIPLSDFFNFSITIFIITLKTPLDLIAEYQ